MSKKIKNLLKIKFKKIFDSCIINITSLIKKKQKFKKKIKFRIDYSRLKIFFCRFNFAQIIRLTHKRQQTSNKIFYANNLNTNPQKKFFYSF